MKEWLLGRVHVSWFIGWLCCGTLLGIVLCIFAPTNIFSSPAWLIMSAALILCALIRRARIALLIVCFSGLLLGLWRGSIVQQQLSQYENYYGQTVVLEGKVVQDVSYGPKGDQRLRIGNIEIGDQHFAGEVWVSSREKLDIKRGDSVKLEGQLDSGFGSLSAAMFRAEVLDIKRPIPGDIGRQFRDWFAGAIRKAIDEPEVSLGLGYLLGQKSALPENLEKQIQMIGLTHVVVASGYNLTILVAFARRMLARTSKYLATLAGSFLIAGFVLITGFTPSMSRAGLVAALSLLAWYYGRRIHPIILLAIAAAVTAVIRPTYMWGDLGWYLSFAAFFGVLVLAPLLHQYFWGAAKKPGFLRELVVSTMSAQVVTLPIILMAFGTYSIYALPANMLVLPMVPFAMLATFIAGIGSLVMPFASDLFGLPAALLLKYCIFVIDQFARLPHAQSELSFSILQVGISFVAILCVVTYIARITGFNFRLSKTIID
jgi:competence protein ComEC